MSGLSWLALLAPFIMIFAFGGVLARGTVAQVQGVYWGYAAVMGAALAPVFIAYTGTSITRIFLITAAMFGGMSLYGTVTKRDLTGMGNFLMMGLFGIIIASIVNIFLASSMMDLVISCIGVLIFTGLTAYDTQKLRVFGMNAPVDDATAMRRGALLGALELYLDFINLFLMLLRLFGGNRD